MSQVEVIRVLVNQRLNAVAEEIVELFEKTIAEYQASLARLSEETERQRRLLGAAGGASQQAEFQQELAIKDVPPKEQNLGTPLNGAYSSVRHIKEEQEEMWSSQEGEQLQGVQETTFSCVQVEQGNVQYILNVVHGDFQQMQGYNQEAPSEKPECTPALKKEDPEQPSDMEQENIIYQEREKLMELEEKSSPEFSFIPVPVKCEAEEPGSAQLHERQTENIIKAEPPDSSSTQHMETESDGEDCGGAEPPTSLASEKTSDSSDSQTEDSDDDWKRTTTKQSKVKVVMDKKEVKSTPVQKVALDPAPVSEDKTSDSSSAETEDSDADLEKSKESRSGLNRSHSRQHLKKRTKTQTFHCSQHFIHKTNVDKGHVRTSSPGRLSSSSASKKSKGSASLKAKNSKDKSFICSSCGKSFQKKSHLVLHMKTHNRKSNLSGPDSR